MFRSERDESKYSVDRLLAWECVLPYRYISILESDRVEAEALAKFFKRVFDPDTLKEALCKVRPDLF